jgi:uncharacterized protein (DUF486 family)
LLFFQFSLWFLKEDFHYHRLWYILLLYIFISI